MLTLAAKKTYQIERGWLYDQGRINETIEILENGDPLTEIKTNRQKENFLRELISPRVTHIFFFDGERLEALADDEVAAGSG